LQLFQGSSVRLLIPLFLGVSAMPLVGQSPGVQPDTQSANLASSLGTSLRPKLGRNTRTMLLGAAGVGAAISLFDSRLLTGAHRLGGEEMRTSSSIGTFVGGPVPLTLGATLYALGRGTGSSFSEGLGREVIRAVLVSGAITAVTKGVVGRARPFAAPGDPDMFSPGHGFTNGSLASFPSGHTSAAFATATVLARELGVAHPEARWIVNPLLFGGATFVGFSRVYDRQHWPSDVIAGAALGAITGFEVVAHAHGDRSPIGRRLFSHLSLGPSTHGLAIAWSR
jgi:membrane-associated phospholipid phosphatase